MMYVIFLNAIEVKIDFWSVIKSNWQSVPYLFNITNKSEALKVLQPSVPQYRGSIMLNHGLFF